MNNKTNADIKIWLVSRPLNIINLERGIVFFVRRFLLFHYLTFSYAKMKTNPNLKNNKHAFITVHIIYRLLADREKVGAATASDVTAVSFQINKCLECVIIYHCIRVILLYKHNLNQ